MADACWNSIGVRGDGSCPELERYVHCHNCPVYSQAALELLGGEAPAGYREEWTTHFATPKRAEDGDTQTIVIFRIGAEWLALPVPAVTEVANLRPIHSLPHRRSGVVLGLANIRGELAGLRVARPGARAGTSPKTIGRLAAARTGGSS